MVVAHPVTHRPRHGTQKQSALEFAAAYHQRDHSGYLRAVLNKEPHLLLFGEFPHLLTGDTHREVGLRYPYLSVKAWPAHGDKNLDRFFPEREAEALQRHGHTRVEKRIRPFHFDMPDCGFVHTLASVFGDVVDGVRRATASRFLNLEFDGNFGGFGKRQLAGKVGENLAVINRDALAAHQIDGAFA